MSVAVTIMHRPEPKICKYFIQPR